MPDQIEYSPGLRSGTSGWDHCDPEFPHISTDVNSQAAGKETVFQTLAGIKKKKKTIDI